MNYDDIKKGMMRLWKQTFHDSDEYISLVFDNYFNPELIACELKDDRIVSALLGVPYSCSCRSVDNQDDAPKGLYLCGLATEPECRAEGLMSKLIEEINRKAFQLGFDFTFLIPANEGLIKYYFDRDYVEAFYKVENRYIISHDFRNELYGHISGNPNSAEKLIEEFDNIKVKEIDGSDADEVLKFVEFVIFMEHENQYPSIIHTADDIDIIIRENKISGGRIYISVSSSGNITGAAFIAGVNEGEVDVRHIINADEMSRLALLQGIGRCFKSCASTIRVARHPGAVERKALWQPVFGAALPENPHVGAFGEIEVPYSPADFSEPYGMLRLLRPEKILRLLKCVRSEFPLEISRIDDSESLIITTPEGEYSVGTPPSGAKAESAAISLTLKQLAEIVFRRPKGPKILSEAFGLAELPMNMALMLD